jgi:hypothetical protein
MLAAVLSLMEIILAAVSRTEIRVPSGSVWSSPEGRLLSRAVMVSDWSQPILPDSMALPSASST